MKVSLIITTYNRPDALRAVLESVRRQSRLPDETLVVDDGSDDRTEAEVRRFEATIPRLGHLWQENRGFRPARMRNWGIAEAEGDYLVVIDGDMALGRDFVADHVASAQPGQYLQGVRIPLNARATSAYLRRPFRVRPWHVDGWSKTKYLLRSPALASSLNREPRDRLTRIHSCNQSFWREDLLRVNGFDERLNGFGGEDIDLCRRLLWTGVLQMRLRFLALAYHLHHPPSANWSQVHRLEHESPWAMLGVDQHLPTILPFAVARAGKHAEQMPQRSTLNLRRA